MLTTKNPNHTRRLTLKRRYGERVQIGEAWLYVERKGDYVIALHIDAPDHVKILREELVPEDERPARSLFPITDL